MPFADIRFPDDIAYGSSGGPVYATDIVATYSGHEQRNRQWGQARGRYNVAHGVKTREQLDALIAFFRARGGRAQAFRFRDWTDYRATAQVLGTGDGTTTVYPLIRTYSSGTDTETRRITRPVAGTCSVTLNHTPQPTGWTLNTTTGTLTFNTAPASGVVIRADFEFDVPVRFDTDRLSAALDAYGSYSWLDIPIVEVRE